jgi:hypothetical protein
MRLEFVEGSTAVYGLAHVIASLTVTNKELKALALADKEMTLDQFEQLQELQRIKTKDENGEVVEEQKVSQHMGIVDIFYDGCNWSSVVTGRGGQ